MPLYAQAARPDLAKLKAEAQNVVSIIKGDKAKTDVYCQINDLGEQIDGADQKKAEALSQQVIELEKKLGPEYSVLVNDLKNVDTLRSETPRPPDRSARLPYTKA